MALCEENDGDQDEVNHLLDQIVKSDEKYLVHLLQYAAYLDPNYIDIKILVKLFCKHEDALKKEYIEPLYKLSLIYVVESDESFSIKAKSDVIDYIKSYIPDDQIDFFLLEKEILIKLVPVLNELMPEVSANPDDRWINAENASKYVPKILEGRSNLDLETVAPDLVQLLNKMWAYNQYITRDYSLALKYQEEVNKMLQEMPGDANLDEATSFSNMGATYKSSGNYPKSLEKYQEALEVRKKLPEENLDLASAFNDLGYAYKSLGKYQEAFDNHTLASEKAEQLSEKNSLVFASSLNGIGCVYGAFGLQGLALKYHLAALEIRKALLGKEHFLVAYSFSNIGSIYGALDEHEEALNYKNQALEIFQKIYKNPHPDVVAALNNVSNTYEKLDLYVKSVELRLQVLEIGKKLLGEEHPDFAVYLNNIGNSYEKSGECERALEYHMRALEMRKKLLGENHPDVAVSFNNIGAIHKKLLNYDLAVEYKLKALKIWEELPVKHPLEFSKVSYEIRRLEELIMKDKDSEDKMQLDQPGDGNAEQSTELGLLGSTLEDLPE